MSRSKGQDKASVNLREREEGNQFALARAAQDLELVKLRVHQAIKRGGMKDLLEPAEQLISETIERITRVSA